MKQSQFLSDCGVPLLKATSTGTTMRGTEGPVVATRTMKRCAHIFIQSTYTYNIRCRVPGTAADTESTTALIASNIEMHALTTVMKPRVVTAMIMLKQMLFRYQGHIGATLVLDNLYCVTMGFSQLAAMAIFEDEVSQLVTRTIQVSVGISNDIGSGSNVDACVITASGTEMLRNLVKPNERVEKERRYVFRRGTTALKDKVKRWVVDEEEVTPVGWWGGDRYEPRVTYRYGLPHQCILTVQL
ncbi:hypothetical protein BC629DRAFT_1583427 [Irpex lacteus]|nr:hypothetical protein BC629DRAFT_1583427 [Irpex lacteus]